MRLQQNDEVRPTAPLTIDRKASRLASWIAMYPLLGAAVAFTGWFAGLRRLTDWDADGIAQMANSALAICVASAAVLLALRGRRMLARSLAAFAGLIAAATLFEHATAIDLGIDQLLVRAEWGQRGAVSPGRMGLPASIALIVLSTSIVCLTLPRLRRLALGGGAFTIGVSLLSIIGYVFGADTLYSLPHSTAIALQTSTMLLSIAIAIVVSLPDTAPIRLVMGDSAAALLVRRTLPAVTVLPIVLGWLRLRGQELGLFDTAFGTALLVLVLMSLLVGVLLWCAAAIAAHETALVRSRDRLAAILGSITDPLFTVDENWRVQFVNEHAENLLGPDAKVLGTSVWDHLPEGTDTSAHEGLLRSMSLRVPVDYEIYSRASERWLLIRAYPKSSGGIALHARDITERKLSEQAIRESEQKFALLFDKAAFAVSLTDLPTGVFVNVNEAFTELFGYSREEVIGRTSESLGISAPEAERPELRTRAESEGIHDVELRLTTRSGEQRTVLTNATVVEISNRRFVLATLRDVTERKAAEEALRASAAALRAADRMKDEFLATLSHELRTPLTSIIGWSQMLMGGSLDDATRNVALGAIRTNAKAQAQLIEDVLDVSRIITGKMRLERRDSDLAAVVDAAIATVRPAAEARRIGLRMELDRAIPRAFVDPDRLQQVVWNLLSNAIKFSPERTIVDVVLRRDPDAIVIEVADEGPGIDPRFVPFLFERFRQADSSSSRAHSGLGIGLALTKDLLELHGGTIAVESERGRGSRFTVRLPLPGGDEVPAARFEEREAVTLEGVRVLYVDDRADARLLVSSMLQRHGARVAEAESVDEALSVLANESADVIVTDLAMPARDGFDLLASVRADERWQRVPVLALTAQGRVEDEAHAAAAGFRAFLRKPIESQELAAAIASVTGSRPESGVS